MYKNFSFAGDRAGQLRHAGKMNNRPIIAALTVGTPGLVTEELAEFFREAIRRARARRQPLVPAGRWHCLRAGPDTPLWNALAQAVAVRLRRRGSKARLARLLGISRQRLHLLLVARRAYPDAERALLLLFWLQSAAPRHRPPTARPG